MTDNEMAEEYEEKAECVEINGDGKKIYDSIDIQQAFLTGLKTGRKENAELKEQTESYKAFESHCDEIEEDAKVIAKENEELKEKCTELKTKKIPQLERKIASIRGCHSVAVKKLNARIEQVERLKKENAELREQVKQMKCCGSL